MKILDSNGKIYTSFREIERDGGINHACLSRAFKKHNTTKSRKTGITYTLLEYEDDEIKQPDPAEVSKYSDEEISAFLESRKVEDLPFVLHEFKLRKADEGLKYAVALFSDAHIEETVESSTVLGLNRYDIDIARERIRCYFNRLALCLNADRADALIFASLGDTISGYIHDELAQTNGLSPLEAIYEAQNILLNGLKFIVENTSVTDIKFIGICGNHSRTTKRIQFANGYRMSYEWLMYKNIEKEARLLDLPISFVIPESELVLLDAPDGKRFLFMHGYQIKGSGTNTVCGIYPALNRLTMKYDRTFHQDRVYLGHFHSCVSIPNAVINGSIIGYTAHSMNNGFAHEEPAQMYQLFDTHIGEVLTRKIYCK